MGPSVQAAAGLARSTPLADGDLQKEAPSQPLSRASTAESSSIARGAAPQPRYLGADDDEEGAAIVPALAPEELGASELLEKLGIKAQYDPAPQSAARAARGVVDLES